MAEVTPALGDIVYEDDVRVIEFSPAVDVLKGEVVTLADGQLAATTVRGPFGVAIEDCLSTETKGFAVAPTTIYLKGDTATVTAYTRVVAGTANAGRVEDWNAEGIDCIIGAALDDAIAAGAVGKVRLGLW